VAVAAVLATEPVVLEPVVLAEAVAAVPVVVLAEAPATSN